MGNLMFYSMYKIGDRFVISRVRWFPEHSAQPQTSRKLKNVLSRMFFVLFLRL
jgi:hypothetical protein